MARDNKDQVQDHIGHASHRQEIEGPPGVPLGPEDGRAEVIEHIGGHPTEVDAQIEGGETDHILRRAHQLQHLPAQQRAHYQKDQTAAQGQGDGGVDAAADVLLPAGPQIPGHHHVGPHREADKEVDQQVDEGGGGADGRQGLLAGKAAHHDHIGGVEQELQDAGEHQGQREQQQLSGQGAVYHIDAVALFLFFHMRGPLPSKISGKDVQRPFVFSRASKLYHIPEKRTSPKSKNNPHKSVGFAMI